MKQFEEELLKDDWTRVKPEVEVKKISIPQGVERCELNRKCSVRLRELILNDLTVFYPQS